jgi:hypothetical protein
LITIFPAHTQQQHNSIRPINKNRRVKGERNKQVKFGTTFVLFITIMAGSGAPLPSSFDGDEYVPKTKAHDTIKKTLPTNETKPETSTVNPAGKNSPGS